MTDATPGPIPQQVTRPAASLALVRGATRRERLRETAWELVGQPLMRITFHNWYGVRRAILRAFGATVHPTARIRPSVKVSHPWRLRVGAHTAIGDHAVLFCLGEITIGDRCTVSQYTHLCAAGHDYTKPAMPLITKPITLEDDAWVAADVFVGPGVTIGCDTVVGARSTVLNSLPPKSICAGDRARRLGPRVMPGDPPPDTADAPAAAGGRA